MFKPVLLLGAGVKRSPSMLLKMSKPMPTLTTWMAVDVIPEQSLFYCGRPGVFGQRAANIIQQKADAIFCIGARLDNEQVAYDYEGFAPNAIKYVFDIDRSELRKFPQNDKWKTTDDVDDIVSWYNEAAERCGEQWIEWARGLYKRMRPEIDGKPGGEYVDPFYFMTRLSEACNGNENLAIGSSAFAPNSFLQSFKVKRGQIVTVCATFGAMGMDIPMAIGACVGKKRNTICVTGDGGFMLNIQELEVIRREKLPIKFFVYSNGGYGSIRAMQDLRFKNRVGCDAASGFTIPPISRIAHLANMTYSKMETLDENDNMLQNIVDSELPEICEVMVDENWVQWPKVMSSMDANGVMTPDKMEDMTPHLDAEELKRLMNWGV